MSAGRQPTPANDVTPPDLLEHERAYHGFNVLLRWCMVLLAATLSWLTLWLATPAGLLAGLIVGAGVFALGYLVLVRHEQRQPLDPWRPQ